ncbi:hypothetical protein [Burkholderia sp. Ac-20365]|uniref:hypothetical protein n=1 Tax=Burkholderia sp. Ac-20365 TaxID=2703897 RepID=UPI00197B32C4|nr:hypothetical protein [Burkholderia sp. Ac-20365]MBN3764309.1 hypothetical protein [Burkholderia sp. Ac-20365]
MATEPSRDATRSEVDRNSTSLEEPFEPIFTVFMPYAVRNGTTAQARESTFTPEAFDSWFSTMHFLGGDVRVSVWFKVVSHIADASERINPHPRAEKETYYIPLA